MYYQKLAKKCVESMPNGVCRCEPCELNELGRYLDNDQEFYNELCDVHMRMLGKDNWLTNYERFTETQKFVESVYKAIGRDVKRQRVMNGFLAGMYKASKSNG